MYVCGEIDGGEEGSGTKIELETKQAKTIGLETQEIGYGIKKKLKEANHYLDVFEDR